MRTLTKILLLIFAATSNILAYSVHDPANLSNVSFISVSWDDEYNEIFSKDTVSTLTGQEKAVVLCFFTSCSS